MAETEEPRGVDRRKFLKGLAAAAGAVGLSALDNALTGGKLKEAGVEFLGAYGVRFTDAPQDFLPWLNGKLETDKPKDATSFRIEVGAFPFNVTKGDGLDFAVVGSNAELGKSRIYMRDSKNQPDKVYSMWMIKVPPEGPVSDRVTHFILSASPMYHTDWVLAFEGNPSYLNAKLAPFKGARPTGLPTLFFHHPFAPEFNKDVGQGNTWNRIVKVERTGPEGYGPKALDALRKIMTTPMENTLEFPPK